MGISWVTLTLLGTSRPLSAMYKQCHLAQNKNTPVYVLDTKDIFLIKGILTKGINPFFLSLGSD